MVEHCTLWYGFDGSIASSVSGDLVRDIETKLQESKCFNHSMHVQNFHTLLIERTEDDWDAFEQET